MTPPNGIRNGEREWRDDRKLVLHELERLNIGMEELKRDNRTSAAKQENKIMLLHTELVMLKTKASIWGGAIGVIGGIVATFVLSAFNK